MVFFFESVSLPKFNMKVLNLTEKDVSDLLSSPVTWALVSASTAYVFYRYLTSSFGYFSDQGIPGPRPYPIVGNIWGVWKQNLPKHDQELMKKYGKVVGFFDGSSPNLWTTDTDIIKSVMVKDFDHFINRRDFNFRSKVVRKFLTVIRDQDWKDIRSSVTPTFTTGKIKRMSFMIKECAERLSTQLESIATNEGKINAKIQFSALTMDVIARCAFGMSIENLGSDDDPFMKNAKNVFSTPVSKNPFILIPLIFPRLIKIVGERVFISKEFQFFVDIVKNLMAERAASKQKYNDFVEISAESIGHYTKQVDGKTVPMWDKEEIEEIVIAQSTLFLLAGFDTTASTLTNTAYLLAKNPDIQEKLFDQIQDRFEKFGEVNHEMILDFTYMDQVIHEVMRMHAALPRIERECNKDIIIKNVRIKKGMLVTVPTYALHYDPDYYPDPYTFNPDRWSPENKSSLNAHAYVPFGLGPRSCVGMRFAMEELKLVLCVILKKYRFFPVAETPEELRVEDGFFSVAQPVDAILGIHSRQ